jgi:hypothetical protein
LYDANERTGRHRTNGRLQHAASGSCAAMARDAWRSTTLPEWRSYTLPKQPHTFDAVRPRKAMAGPSPANRR